MADAEGLKAVAFPQEAVSIRNLETESGEIAPKFDSPGQSMGDRDATEIALAAALDSAAKAGEWSVVARVAGELEARRLERSSIVDLSLERKRRNAR